jgi:hypothetical protein
MAAQVQKLSYDEFKVEMRSSLRDRGVVDSLKSQVRASLVQELQAKSLGGARPQGKPELGLAQKAVNALIADFLRASTMPYTLSVFGPESGGGLSAANSAAPTARPDIMIGLGLTNVDAPCPAGMSLLEALLAHMRATLNKATAVCEVQTDPPRSADDAVDVEARLRDLDERFLRQSEAERGNPARGVEERMAQYQRECDERARTEIAAEVERLRETEISHARSEERAHFAAELSTRLDELEKEHSDRLARQRRREQEVMARLAEKERSLEMESHAHRQRLLEDLERVNQKQADLDRQKVQHDRQCEADRQRASERERELAEEAARLRAEPSHMSAPSLQIPETVQQSQMTSPTGLPPTPNPDQVAKLERRVSDLLDSEERLQDELEQLRERNQVLEEQMASQSEGEEGAMAMLSLRQELAKAHNDVATLQEQVDEAKQQRDAADRRAEVAAEQALAAAATAAAVSSAQGSSAVAQPAASLGAPSSMAAVGIKAELDAEIR